VLAGAALVATAGLALVLAGPSDLRLLGACIACGPGDLAVGIAGPAGANSGDGLAYRIHGYSGKEGASEVVITVIPPGEIPISQVEFKSNYKVQRGIDSFTIELSSVPALWDVVIGDVFFSAPAGPVTLTTKVSIQAAKPEDPNPRNNGAAAVTTVNAPTPAPTAVPTYAPTPVPTPTPTPAPQADLSVTQSLHQASGGGPLTRAPAGGSVAYFADVVNGGPSDATSVVVQATLPSGVTPTAMNPSCTFAAGVLTCTAASLRAGPVFDGSDRTSFGAEFVVPASGPMTAHASVSATQADPNVANNTNNASWDVTPATDLSVAQTASVSGPRITYTITLTNAGPSISTDAGVLDTVPTGTTYISVTSPQAVGAPTTPICGLDPPSGKYGCRFQPIVAGGTATMTLVVNASGPGSYANRADAVVGQFDYDPNTANNSSTLVTTVP
jgi:uncharacterized repeat protein (TIGR01451 family)